VVDVLRLALASNELLAALQRAQMTPTPLSSMLSLHDGGPLALLRTEHVVLDCAGSWPQCWRVAGRVGSAHLMRFSRRVRRVHFEDAP
jgi:hypothetical protein